MRRPKRPKQRAVDAYYLLDQITAGLGSVLEDVADLRESSDPAVRQIAKNLDGAISVAMLYADNEQKSIPPGDDYE